MKTYELYNKQERNEILGDFNCYGSWMEQEKGHYISDEIQVSMDIEPHLPYRCFERNVSDMAFSLAIETFFAKPAFEQLSGEKIFAVEDLYDGDSVVLTYPKYKISFVFNFIGKDECTGKYQILAKTVTPFLGYKKQIFRTGNRVFELTDSENGEFEVSFVDESDLNFK